MTTYRKFRMSRLGLAALAVLLTGAAFGQATGTKYSVTLVGPTNPEQMNSLGIDALGRIAGNCSYYDNGQLETNAWTFDAGLGFVLSPHEDTTINAVSPDGLLVGSAQGHLAVFDWMGNPQQVLPTLNGQLMTVNSMHTSAGYLYDPLNGGVQTAFIFDRYFNMIRLGALDRSASAAYGINDNGVAVGFSGNTFEKARACYWTERTVFLPGLPGNTTCANAVNNLFTIVGYTVTPKNRVMPIKWTVTPRFAVTTLIDLPAGYPNGNAIAINDNNQIVGTMWTENGRFSRAFVTGQDGHILDLNYLVTPNGSKCTLISATAINAKGSITGIAEVRTLTGVRLMAYVAAPINGSRG